MGRNEGMAMRFDGKSVIVTGAASGFGEAIARRFAAEGANVMVADINEAGAAALSAELDGSMPFTIDVTDEAQTETMCNVAAESWGGIDVICANAGLPHRASKMVDVSTEDFDRMWFVNVRSVYFAAKYGLPHMPDGSSIISTASIGGKRPRKNMTPYNASKAAVITLTKGLAAELAPRIRVNCVCPVSSPTGFDMGVIGKPELEPHVQELLVKGIRCGAGRCPTTSPGPSHSSPLTTPGF